MHDTDERNAPINILNLFSRTSNLHHFLIKNSRLKYTKEFVLSRWRKDMERDAK